MENSDLKDQRVTVMMSSAELEKIDEWCHMNKIRSRGEGVRRLIDAGMEIPAYASNLTATISNHIRNEYPEVDSAVQGLWRVLERHYVGLVDAEEAGDEMDSPEVHFDELSVNQQRVINLLIDKRLRELGVIQQAVAPDFTVRERQIAQALRDGMPNKAIAYDLKLSESTVKVHVRNIMKKINADNRFDAAKWLNQPFNKGEGGH